MRCMNCKRLGHTKKWCRRTSPTCSKCAEEHHPTLCCNKPLRCVNCSEEHNALERKCPFYQFECEVLATQTKKRISFPEAEEEVKERFRQDGKQFRFVSYVSRVGNGSIRPKSIRPLSNSAPARSTRPLRKSTRPLRESIRPIGPI